MNANLYERKEFLNKSWISANSTEMFTSFVKNNKSIVQVNLLRATANESDLFNNYLMDLTEKTKNPIIFDLSECNFVDSTFLSSMLSFNKKYEAKVELVVADIRQLTIFKITKLDKIFNIYSTLDTAVIA